MLLVLGYDKNNNSLLGYYVKYFLIVIYLVLKILDEVCNIVILIVGYGIWSLERLGNLVKVTYSSD